MVVVADWVRRQTERKECERQDHDDERYELREMVGES